VRSTSALVFALILLASTAMAQPPAVSLRGHVVDAENERPLRRSIVSLARGDLRVRPVLTDEDGSFVIELPEPSSAIVITKAGYASVVIEPDRRTLTRELDIRLDRGAVMSGRVIEQGVLAIGARVVARRVDDVSNTKPTYEAETDDLGEYRIGGLPAGQYTVTAHNTPQSVRLTPGFATDREAVQGIVSRRLPGYAGTTPLGLPDSKRVVDVRAGQETGEVDFDVAPLQVTTGPGTTPDFVRLTENDPGVITGRVVTPSGQPVSGALLAISGNKQMRLVLADASGRFDAGRFKDGEYTIEIGKSGYLTPEFRGPSLIETARMVHIRPDAREHDIEVVLARGGAIVGAITDSAGEPFQGVLVRAMRLRQVGARTVATAAGWPRLTDERGRYRIFGLPPGSYLIVASLNATEPALDRRSVVGFAPVYYPATARVESAQTVQVELESAITGVDLTFAASATARVTGKALNAAGDPLAGRVVLAVSARSGSVAPDPRFARIASDGSFELSDVSPGDYVLQALGDRAPGVAPEFGSEYITVAEHNAPPVTIRTNPGATLEGRFTSEGRATIPLRAQALHAAPLDVDRSPPDGRGPEGLAVHDDGRFYLTGLFGPMRLTYPAPAGWYLTSITIGGIDVTDQSFDFGFGDQIFSDADIVLANTGARIAGTVSDAADRRVTEFAVVAFSANRAHWFAGSRYVRWAATTPNGSFDVGDLPPGDYLVAAVDALPPGDWQALDGLDALVPRATRVTLTEGQARTITLPLTRR
jgi:Carboxypeptidase regulatory-like domain